MMMIMRMYEMYRQVLRDVQSFSCNTFNAAFLHTLYMAGTASHPVIALELSSLSLVEEDNASLIEAML